MQLNYLRMVLRGMMLLIGYIIAAPRQPISPKQIEVIEHIREWNKDCNCLIKDDRKRHKYPRTIDEIFKDA